MARGEERKEWRERGRGQVNSKEEIVETSAKRLRSKEEKLSRKPTVMQIKEINKGTAKG